MLDFDDLIRRTLALLTDRGVAEWVLFKLDGGIDHILVDEAQDTSPRQWAIIDRLAAEFATGEGARPGVVRTIFAVGDQKQSIYSFQGADPGEFARMRADFAGRLGAVGVTLQELALRHSFRSSPAILRLVDAVFGGPDTPGVGETEHRAFYPDRPGRVDLWPMIERVKPDPAPSGGRPTTAPAPRRRPSSWPASWPARCAGWSIPSSVIEAGQPRRMRAGDILILVRRRDYINEPLISALKREGLDVAGSDQIELASDLAVTDVLAVLEVPRHPRRFAVAGDRAAVAAVRDQRGRALRPGP